MNKFAFSLIKEIGSYFEKNTEYSADSKIKDLFCESFHEFSWIECIVSVELIYGFDVPDELVEKTYLTILEFGAKLSDLPLIKDSLYPEFFEIKRIMMRDLRKLGLIEFGEVEGTFSEVEEIERRLDKLDQRREEIIKESTS